MAIFSKTAARSARHMKKTPSAAFSNPAADATSGWATRAFYCQSGGVYKFPLDLFTLLKAVCFGSYWYFNL